MCGRSRGNILRLARRWPGDRPNARHEALGAVSVRSTTAPRLTRPGVRARSHPALPGSRLVPLLRGGTFKQSALVKRVAIATRPLRPWRSSCWRLPRASRGAAIPMKLGSGDHASLTSGRTRPTITPWAGAGLIDRLPAGLADNQHQAAPDRPSGVPAVLLPRLWGPGDQPAPRPLRNMQRGGPWPVCPGASEQGPGHRCS
jgi:hypothetical protein